MSTDTSSPLTAPRDTILQPLGDDPFTPEQWTTLLAIADTFIPAIQRRPDADSSLHLGLDDAAYNETFDKIKSLSHEKDDDVVKDFLEESATLSPAFRESVYRLIGLSMAQDARKNLIMVLNLLNTRPGSLFLTGYVTPFAQQPLHIRDAIMRGWTTARLPTLRALQKSLASLVKQLWIRSSPTLPRVLGLPRVPHNWRVGEGFDFDFVQMPPGDGPEVLDTDVVIVGSGCGAGVCAKNLAEAGHRVLVVEKAYHWPAAFFPMTESAAQSLLYMNDGPIVSDDLSMLILAGQTWGGGGTVNWSASLQTQGYVREEWAAAGLPFFTSPAYQASLDRVCARMGVSAAHVDPNRANRDLLEGARRLGWAHKPVPQNTGGAAHACGSCTLGCAACEKQGPANSFLPDAARAGARFVEGLDVREVLFDDPDVATGERVAVGVRGVWTSRDAHRGVADRASIRRREVVVRAKRVVVSCGTMQSPLLLLRSGLRNPHIGRNLHLHPVQVVAAVHDEDTVPWEGGILTSVVGEFENLDGQGHGVKLEACVMVPGFFLPLLPWPAHEGGGLGFKLLAAKMRRMAGYIAIARDADTGRVYPDPTDGRPRVAYSPSKRDRAHILKGLEALARICHAQGAREIVAGTPGVPSYVRPDGASSAAQALEPDKGFVEFLARLKARGVPSPDTPFPSAHQMGTCRMAASPRAGVVDPHGRVWGVKGLYVADASVFPSASGVNPMISNMATADWISQWVGEGLRSSGGVEARL